MKISHQHVGYLQVNMGFDIVSFKSVDVGKNYSVTQ